MIIDALNMFNFDYYNESEIPNFYLANPDNTVLFNLGTIYNRKFEIRYNSLSTLTFTAPSKVDGIKTDYFDFLEYRRLIIVENVGNFMITNVETKDDGIVETKEITCKSLEVVFSYKKINLFEGRYAFDNSITSGSTVIAGNLIQTLLSYVPGWTLGNENSLDINLKNTVRSFSVSDKTIYDFMVNDVSQTFQCVFVFDNIEKKIYAYPIKAISQLTDIYISFDNLMKSASIKESTDELSTALNVIGGDGIYISNVNPIGGNTIYNFQWYKNTNWMEQSLIDAIDNWENKINSNQSSYANLMTQLRVTSGSLINYQSQLATYQGNLATHTAVKDTLILSGQDTTAISGSIAVDNANIATANTNIANTNYAISLIQAQLNYIHTQLSFENNFTQNQLSTLNNFIIGNTYTDTNFIKTSMMTEYQIQDISQALYDQAKDILDTKISLPRYTFEIDSANFLFIREFQPFVEQLQLGSQITVELSSGSVLAVLLGFDFNYDNVTDFKLILSNRMRLDDDEFQYNDLYGSVVDGGITTNFNSQKWNAMTTSYQGATSQGGMMVFSSQYISGSHIPIYSGNYTSASSVGVEDRGALYVPPTNYIPSLYSTGATFNYTSREGTYSIIGKTATFQAKILLNGTPTGTLTNPFNINLPVSYKRGMNSGVIINVFIAPLSMPSGYAYTFGYMDSGWGGIIFYKGTNTGINYLFPNELGSNATIYISGSYLID